MGPVTPCLHLHWHTVVKLLYGLVVDCDGHLRVGVKGELDIVAGPVLPRRLVTRQLQVLAASAQGRRGTFQITGRCGAAAALQRRSGAAQQRRSSAGNHKGESLVCVGGPTVQAAACLYGCL